MSPVMIFSREDSFIEIQVSGFLSAFPVFGFAPLRQAASRKVGKKQLLSVRPMT